MNRCRPRAPGTLAMAAAALLAAMSTRAGPPLDPRATVLPAYRLPDSAAVDGRFDEWAGVPAVPAEQFKLNLATNTLTGSADFGPSLRCGLKAGSRDLYFLVVVRDSELRAESSYNGLGGDCLELYFDFGREERDRTEPDWYKAPYRNAYYPRQEPPRCLGQFVLRPPTLLSPARTFKSPNADAWILDAACALVEGGVAYEARLDAASVLAALRMTSMPETVGFDVGLMDQDLAPRLQAENWANDDGLYRLFGSWVDDVVPTGYGRLATCPAAPQPALRAAAPLPAPLRRVFGDRPTARDLRRALRRDPPERAAARVEWAGLQGLRLDPALARDLATAAAPEVREACLAVLAYTPQPPETVRTALDAVRGQPQPPAVLALSNLLSQRRAHGPADWFRAQLAHEDLTVVFTAAAALAAVGDATDLPRLDAACASLCAALTNAPAARAIRDTGYHHWYAGKARRVTAAHQFFGVAREALRARLDPGEAPPFTPVRELRAANTDLERFLPPDGNNVYSATGLLRRWPTRGPRELWRATVGQGKSAVVESAGRAFTAAIADGRQWVVCLDPATGRALWRQPLLPPDEPAGAEEIVATPLLDGDRVYCVPAGPRQEEGRGIVCLRAADGRELWRGGTNLEHTAACPTPLIVGETLYCPLYRTGEPLPALAAVDKHTGALRWTAPASGSGHSCGSGIASPTYQVIAGLGQIILSVYGDPVNEVWGLSAATGERFWRYEADGHYGLIPSPVAVGSRVFVCDGLPPFSACLQMVARDGRLAARQVYHDEERQCNLYNTVAVLDGCVYGFGNAALQCTRLDDGALLWEHADPDWTGGPQLIVADGLIFALGTFQLVLAEATPSGYRERGRVRHGVELGYPQQPTLANGRLYLRGNRDVVCYDALHPAD